MQLFYPVEPGGRARDYIGINHQRLRPVAWKIAAAQCQPTAGAEIGWQTCLTEDVPSPSDQCAVILNCQSVIACSDGDSVAQSSRDHALTVVVHSPSEHRAVAPQAHAIQEASKNLAEHRSQPGV